MALPDRIRPEKGKQRKNRTDRWKSEAHRDFVRDHDCCVPGCKQRPIDVAHLRVGTDAGIGRKASDWFTISLCRNHHICDQHIVGEPEFERKHGINLHALAAEFCEKSPRVAEIRRLKAERARDV